MAWVTKSGMVIHGYGELVERLIDVSSLKWLALSLAQVAMHTRSEMAPYPRATAANSPGNTTGRWYERGYGPRWISSDGEVKGKKTSENLRKRWTIKKSQAYTYTLANNASYAIYVQSMQTSATFHKERGWPQDEIVIEEVREVAVPMIKERLTKVLDGGK